MHNWSLGSRGRGARPCPSCALLGPRVLAHPSWLPASGFLATSCAMIKFSGWWQCGWAGGGGSVGGQRVVSRIHNILSK